MQNIHLISHPLIEHKLSILRSKTTDVFQFRELVGEITYLMIFEASRDLATRPTRNRTKSAKMRDLRRLRTEFCVT